MCNSSIMTDLKKDFSIYLLDTPFVKDVFLVSDSILRSLYSDYVICFLKTYRIVIVFAK